MTTIPDDLVRLIEEESNETVARSWPQFEDRDGEVWSATGHRNAGDEVMLPWAGDMHAMLRAEVEAEYGPLTEVTR